MRCLHTLNVLFVLVHKVHTLHTEAKLTDKSGHYNKTAICWINHCLYRGMLGTSLTDWTHLKRAELSRAPGLAYLYAKDLTVYSVALPARWCIAQSNEGDWCVPARLHSALACMLNLYCLIYSYKIILNYLWYFVIICKEHTLQVAGRAVTYRYSTTESLYLFTRKR